MYFTDSAFAALALSVIVSAAAIPNDAVAKNHEIVARFTPPTGTTVACGQLPAGAPALKNRDVHVWERVNELKMNYGEKVGDVSFHKELDDLEDLIGGSHYDVLFGTVGYKEDENKDKTLQFVYREVGLQINQKGWLKKHPNGEGAKISIYNMDLQLNSDGSVKDAEEQKRDVDGVYNLDQRFSTTTLDERDVLEARGDIPKCFYKGIIAKGSTITSATSAAKKGNKTYKVHTTDCTTVTDFILNNIKFT